MDDGLKQRLIGAFVLLALAVIFVPVFFDRERIEPVDKTTQIPIAPIVEPVVVEIATPVPEIETAEPAQEMFIPDEEEKVDLKPEAPGLNEQGVPKSWVLQIASFRFQKHAEELRDTLIEGGYAAYTRTVDTKKGNMTRLYVGPKLDKNILIKQKEEIDAKYKVEAILLKFKP